jgi:hypothetical protein
LLYFIFISRRDDDVWKRPNLHVASLLFISG